MMMGGQTVSVHPSCLVQSAPPERSSSLPLAQPRLLLQLQLDDHRWQLEQKQDAVVVIDAQTGGECGAEMKRW